MKMDVQNKKTIVNDNGTQIAFLNKRNINKK